MQNIRIAWTVAGILAVAVVLLLFLNWRQASSASISAVRGQLAQDCSGSTLNAQRCNDDLTELSSTIQQFSQSFQNATTASTTP